MIIERTQIESLLEGVLKQGAADAEVVLVSDRNLRLAVAKAKVETLALSESVGIGIRVFTADRRMGFAYTTSAEGAADAAKAALENALVTDADEHNVLPYDAGVSDDDWTEQDFESIPVREKVEFCRALEAETLAADGRITHVDEAEYSDSRWEYVLANTRGLLRRFRNAQCSCSVVAAAEESGSDPEMGWEFDAARTFSGLRREWVARRCAERTVRGLGGTPCPTGSRPVVLENFVTTQFLGVLGPALMAHNVLKGKSLFAGNCGETIASERVTIVDQNDLEEGLNRSPFDAEGVSACTTTLVDQGILRGFLHNSYTAHKMGQSTTSNAGRGGGFRGIPEVSASNCFLQPGQHTVDELLGLAGDGLLVTSALGVHTADPISGDFSFGVSGIEIKNGRLDRAVRGVTVAGNLKHLLRDIAAVGDNMRFFGTYGAPSVLISRLMVSGS